MSEQATLQEMYIDFLAKVHRWNGRCRDDGDSAHATTL